MKPMMSLALRTGFVGLLLAVLAGRSTAAFSLMNLVWPSGTSIAMHLQLDSGRFDSAAAAALGAWNAQLATLRVKNGNQNPLARLLAIPGSSASQAERDGVNSVFFSNTIFGDPFGGGTLAVTTTWLRGGFRTEGDVIFNSSLQWDTYDGNLRSGVQDFNRVAIHEFGHVLGLDHPDEEGQIVAAIMNSRVSNTDRLSPDDIAGVQSMYQPDAATPILLSGSVTLPSFDEVIDFRRRLETQFRTLNRPMSTTAVTPEIASIWSREYIRYRVNVCAHVKSIFNVVAQMAGGAAPPVCGVPSSFTVLPVASELSEFRTHVESEFLGRPGNPTSRTSVDFESEANWTLEYYQRRRSGCTHAAAVQAIETQVGGGVPPACS
jgi:hypothetical protein